MRTRLVYAGAIVWLMAAGSAHRVLAQTIWVANPDGTPRDTLTFVDREMVWATVYPGCRQGCTVYVVPCGALPLPANDVTGSGGISVNPFPASLAIIPVWQCPSAGSYDIYVVNRCGDAPQKDNQCFTVTPTGSNFCHVVLVMMENRSFDHFLGWLPGAEGRQAGLTYSNNNGQSFATHALAPYFQGCGCKDPDHSYDGGGIEFNNGLCDGWLRANTNDTFSIGYYRQEDLSFFGQVATNWTVCDHYFSAIMAETQPNRIYQHAAQTDSLVNREGFDAILNPVTLPTIWDRLSQNNVSARYYYPGPNRAWSVLALWGPFKYSAISFGTDQFYQDCANGTLPAVSFVDPLLTSVAEGLHLCDDTCGNDDHPHSDIRKGEAFLASIYNAVVSSPNWSNTVLIINFDEWGGFFDHVPPPKVQIEPAEQALRSTGGSLNDGRLGFRVPCLVISPWARRGYVSSNQFDHCSVLKLIENRWGLAPLTVRDANANDLADVLDFAHPDFTHPPGIITPPGPFGGRCKEIQIVNAADGSVMLTWGDGACQTIIIQSALSPDGPWNDVPGVVSSPYVFRPALTQQFYRSKIN